MLIVDTKWHYRGCQYHAGVFGSLSTGRERREAQMPWRDTDVQIDGRPWRVFKSFSCHVGNSKGDPRARHYFPE